LLAMNHSGTSAPRYKSGSLTLPFFCINLLLTHPKNY
jgi:hypothetical protein